MKSIYLTIAFVFSAFYLSAQSDQLVKVMVYKSQLEYLTTEIVNLQEAVTVVQDAYKRSDDHTIGKTKSSIIKIVHQSPSILSNICSMAKATVVDPNIAGARHGIDYEEIAAKMNEGGKYKEIQLSPDEIKTLTKLVNSMKVRKVKLKSTGYAIHSSQREKGSESNVDSLAKLTAELAEAIELINTAQNR